MIITDSEHKAFCDLMRRSNYYLGELARLFFSGEGKEHRARIILTPFIGREINVASVNVEMSLENIGRRGIRMDVVAIDEDGSMFDVELQRDPGGAHPHRARFNASVIDVHYPVKGVDTNDLRLPETYVLFFTERDYFKEGKAYYTIERKITELSDRPFNDGSHIVYINGEYDDTSTQAGKIIHDLRCVSANDMIVPEIADQTHWLKETEEGYKMMSDEVKALFERSYYSGRKDGLLDGLCNLVGRGDLNPEAASREANMPLSVFMEKMAEYNSSRADA